MRVSVHARAHTSVLTGGYRLSRTALPHARADKLWGAKESAKDTASAASDRAYDAKEQAKHGAWRGAQQARRATETAAENARDATAHSGSYIGGTRACMRAQRAPSAERAMSTALTARPRCTHARADKLWGAKESAKDTANAASDRAHDMKENAKEGAWRGAQQAKEATESVAERAKRAAAEGRSYTGGASRTRARAHACYQPDAASRVRSHSHRCAPHARAIRTFAPTPFPGLLIAQKSWSRAGMRPSQ